MKTTAKTWQPVQLIPEALSLKPAKYEVHHADHDLQRLT
jgi:hypothetical protein